MKKGVLTTIFCIILFLAGLVILAANYLTFPESLANVENIIESFVSASLSISQRENLILLIPGAFLVFEAFFIKVSRKKRPYSIIFFLFLFFIYFTLIVYTHLKSDIPTPAVIMSHVDKSKEGLVVLLIALEAILALVILYVTGHLNQKYRTKLLNASANLDVDGVPKGASDVKISRRQLKKQEAKEKKRIEKEEAKERRKEEKKAQKAQEKLDKETEKAEKEAKAEREREERKLAKKEEKKKKKEDKKKAKEAELIEEDVSERFNTEELKVVNTAPEKAMSMDEPLSFPEFGDIPRLSTIEHNEDLDLVSPDRRNKFKEEMGLKEKEEEFEEEEDKDNLDRFRTKREEKKDPMYKPSQAGAHFKKGGILEATIESMNSYDSSRTSRPKSPILGLDEKEGDSQIKPSDDNFAPKGLSKDHPRYKLFESLREPVNRQSINVSHLPSRPFESEEKVNIDDTLSSLKSSYQSTYKKQEDQKVKLSDRLDQMKRESLSTSNPFVSQTASAIKQNDDVKRNDDLKAKLDRINNMDFSQIKTEEPVRQSEPVKPEPVRQPMRAEDIESVDQKNKGKYDDGSNSDEMQEQTNEIFYSVGIAGLKSNDEGMTGIKRRARLSYKAPSMDILLDYPTADREIDDYTISRGQAILSTLHDFKVDVTLDNIVKGPTVTMYELKLAEGVPVSKIKTRYDDLQYALGVRSIRILAPVPGKQAVGIEVPNSKRATIGFKDMLYTFNALPDKNKMAVPMILGRTITGEPVSINVAKAPHLLIAGSTGSGKSVGINSLIATILYNKSPQEVRLIMVDPKVVELKIYNGIPHLLTPVITESKKVQKVLSWLTDEMDRRYNMISRYNVRNIEAFNEKLKRERLAAEKLPYIVLIMDEYADLMSTIGKDIEYYVGRLAAMARAVGIHLVLATQRPSAEVVTGTIKNNIPSRIAFAVASGVNSKIILDEMGAESLLGKGDMLYKSPTSSETLRIQGAFLSDEEVEKIVEQVKLNGEADYLDDSIFEDHDEKEDDFGDDGFEYVDSEEEEYERAKQIVYEKKSASASYLQRRMKIGYNKAARYVERMEEDGIVGPPNGSKPRELIKML